MADGREYVSVNIDGEKFSLWDKEYFGKLKAGDTVEYKWRQSGRYKNITEIEPTNTHSYPGNNDDRNGQIARMSCLKSASELLANAHMDPLDKATLALDIAKKYEAYIFNNDLPSDVSE